MKRNRILAASMLAGCVWLALLGWLQRDRFLSGVNDFLQLYAGSRLVGTPELYEPEAVRRVQRESVGVDLDSVYYSRPPFYAFLLKPLGKLPYAHAYWTFVLINLACIGWFVWRFGRHKQEIALFACLYPPAILVPLTGQDLGLALALAAAAYLTAEKGDDFCAGLLLSLCSIKLHLFVLAPLVFLIYRRWRVLAGGAAGGAGLVVLSYIAQGPDWPRQYLSLLSAPDFHAGLERMPNLQALRLALAPSAGSWFIPAAGFVVAVVAAAAIWRARDWRLGFAYALCGSLAMSHHAYMHDCLPLLLAFAILLLHEQSQGVIKLAAFVVTPIPTFLVLAGTPWSAVLPAALILLLAIAARYSSPKPLQPIT